MDLQSLLKIKLKKDLLNDFNNYYDNNFKTINKDKDEFIRLCESKINDYISEFNLTFNDTISKKDISNDINNNNICCARIMGPRNTDCRCSHKIHKDDYCKKHLKRIEEYGFLSFGRYDEKRPEINENGNKIIWRDSTPLEDINTIIQYQNNNLMKLIK